MTFLRKQIEQSRKITELKAFILRWKAASTSDEGFLAMVDFARSWRNRLAGMLDADAVGARLSKLRLMSDDVHIWDLKSID